MPIRPAVVDTVRLVSHPVELRSVLEERYLRSLADICKTDRGSLKDQPLTIAEALSFARRAEERNDFLGLIRLVKLRLGHDSPPAHVPRSEAFRSAATRASALCQALRESLP